MKERVLRSDIESAGRLRSAGSNDDGDGGLHAYQLLAVFGIKNRLSGTVACSLSELSKPYRHFHLNPNFSSIPLPRFLLFFNLILFYFTLIALCQNARAFVELRCVIDLEQKMDSSCGLDEGPRPKS